MNSIEVRNRLRAVGVSGEWVGQVADTVRRAALKLYEDGTPADRVTREAAEQAVRVPATAPVPGGLAGFASALGEAASALPIAQEAASEAKAAIDAVMATSDRVNELMGRFAAHGEAMECSNRALNGRVDSLPALVDDAVKAALAAFATSGTAGRRVALAAASATPGGELLKLLSEYYVPGEPGPCNPFMILGPPSVGKTHWVRVLGESYDRFIEHGCTPQPDEVDILLGSASVDVDRGGLTVTDGPLVEAVRAAAAGKRVLLLLDEAPRWSQRSQQSFLTFLPGVKSAAGKLFRLRTRKSADGVREEITCPAANLHIVSTGNPTGVVPEEAFWSRWTKVREDFTVAKAAAVAGSMMTHYGVSYTPANLGTWAAQMEESRRLFAADTIAGPLDFRLMEHGCVHCKEATFASVVERLTPFWLAHATVSDPKTGDAIGESVVAATRIAAALKK